jgi:alpha-amylase
MIHSQNIELLKDWNYLQDSNHFYALSALQQKNRYKQSSFNPFDSPYEAFINYMNILSDFTLRVNDEIPIRDNEIKNNTALMEMILEKEIMIRKLESELQKLKKHKAGPNNKIKKNKRE